MRPVLFIPLVLLGFFLAVYDWRLPQKQISGPQTPASVQAQTPLLPQAQVDQVFDQGQYLITWSNPRYEADEDLQMRTFKIDFKVVNKSFKGQPQLIVNCDLKDGDKIIDGVGVMIDHDTVTVPLEIDYSLSSQTFSLNDDTLFPNRLVSTCRYTPTGAYDPKLAVEVRFW